MNFDNFLFNCSSLSKIMTSDNTKSNLEKYNDAVEKKKKLMADITRCQAEVDAMNPETITAKKKQIVLSNYFDKWDKNQAIISGLEPIKDDITLSQGCQTHLLDLYVAHVRHRQTQDIKSKYIEKGLMLEEDAITTYSAVTQIYYEKNKERRDNGFITGEIDIDADLVLDTKVSWDIFTWQRNLKYISAPESCPYYANMQGYMDLWGKESSKLVYVLLNTPKKMVDLEKNKLAYGFVGGEKLYQEACEELERLLTYDDIPLEERIIEVRINRDEEYIQRIPKVVTECRKYLNNIKKVNYEMAS